MTIIDKITDKLAVVYYDLGLNKVVKANEDDNIPERIRNITESFEKLSMVLGMRFVVIPHFHEISVNYNLADNSKDIKLNLTGKTPEEIIKTVQEKFGKEKVNV